ncbi:MAG: flagellar basal-body rod protein FlgF [Hyphomicrobium sp.]|uniref:flagellar basal-body rod protein FlgF n=1 Tax=Hyphomicrobium sp. TaxID=82 RepID=UPI0013242443|nr:flagellar basal-body rod protein FlgF [Hyphomicrobium sp.]KAB2943253.1 MAG: flagellar basal-body rod protein FlgF [Hyphomicrobium sp.]MBZ0210389.1 flagellar basal-body rod protein FlgF [Hyphomicrobium sp.]MCZ7594048.1 flagellar basal-body rod protein FlgF [Hyphomicrobium sp.]
MQSGLYVALSSQMAFQKRMDTIANNVANASTPGFRREEIKFEAMLDQAASEPVAFASTGDTYIKRDPGQIIRTGNPLDVAVQGDAWLGIQTPSGTVYTRDGRMQITAEGQLQSIAGYPMLDAGGAPIQINPNAGPLQIASDGMITQNGLQLGAIGLFTIDPGASLSRFENSGVIPDQPAVPTLDFNRFGVVQGHIEGSNVNPMWEMSQLILASRSYDAVSNSIDQSEDSLREAIKALGPTS